MIFSSPWLARRLEGAEAANDADCASAQPGAVVEQIAGGRAIFAGAESPLTRAIGLGLNGRVAEQEIETLEQFFETRHAPVSIDVCPLADAGLLDALRNRGYRLSEFNNTMVRPLAGLEPYPADPHLRAISAGEMDTWVQTVGHGFFEQSELTAEEMDVGRAIFRMGKAECYLAITGDGQAGAGAALSIRDGVAVLFADATVPPHRRQGFHAALIRRRLNSAVLQGCDVAAAATVPGSASQRNYERLGFQVAYTKVLLSKA
jgi:GNAT superfamily N-acetyltransferase